MYTSDYPQVSLPKSSVWHYQFPSDSPFDRALPAYIDGITGRTLSRGDVHDDGLRLLSGLRALGVKRGDTACLWGLNSLPWIQAAYGCMAAGVTVSPANYAFSAKELAYQINNSDSSVIFLDASLVPILDEARPQINIAFPDSRVVLLCETKDKPVPARYRCVAELFGAPGKAEVYAGDQVHDTIWMCYSSGTTGFPKGVMSTQHNFTSQLQALKPAVEPLAPGDKMIGFVPLSHTYGTTNALLQPFSVGAACVILPRFEEIAFLRAIERFKIKHGLIVPPIVIVLLHSEHLHKYDLSSLRTLCSAAAPLGEELSKAFEARLPNCKITQCYGLTETSPIITTMTGAERGAHTGFIGRLLPTFDARLVDDNGRDVAAGARGELWVRGPSVMAGYYKNAPATTNTMHREWFKTGDVLVRDAEGWYKVVDRVKELIKYKGFQVPPAELEALLLSHPRIKDAGVVGVYDKSQATELPTAFVCLAPDDCEDTPAFRAEFDREIQAWVAARVARHKRLGGGVHVIDAIPKSASGKILRRFLRDRAQKEHDEGAQTAAARL